MQGSTAAMLEGRSEYQAGSLWFYAPNKGAPIAFSILFAASGFMHAYQCFKYRSWKITGLLPWSALLFAVGFITRVIGAFGEWDNLEVFIVSSVFLQVAPPAYETSNYLTLGRILYYVPYCSPIHPGRVFTTFLALAVVIEVVVANGVSLVANTSNPKSLQDQGKALIKTGLILQLCLMVGFIVLAARFYYRCWKTGVLSNKVKHALHVLLISCTLITVRTIYRVVEYFTVASLDFTDIDNISPILKEEWYFWFFETTMMFLNTSMLNVFPTMRSLPRSNKIYLAQDGVTEVEGPGYDDPRPFILTLVDPFDLTAIILRKKRLEKFWEGAGNDIQPSEDKDQNKDESGSGCRV